jgi:hypothetical protein
MTAAQTSTVTNAQPIAAAGDVGPLTVHDFEQLRRAPYRLVLSSCDSGVLVPVGADPVRQAAAMSLLALGAG